MAEATFKPSLSLTLAHEGGYVNHPKDPGGPTMKGVTQRVYDAYRRNKGQTVRSVKHISEIELQDIYREDYWKKAGCDRLPAGVDYATFDYAVNSGVSRAIKDLQRVCNNVGKHFRINSPHIKVDGVFGQATLDAVKTLCAIDDIHLVEAYCNRRMAFFRSLKTFKTFGKGWTRRLLGDKANETADEGDYGVIDYAVKMARDDLAYPIPKKDLPTPIGVKDGEEAGKALEGDKAVTKSPDGAGAIAASLGVSGATVMSAANEVKPHIGEGTFGTIAAIVFGILMIVGVGLLVYTFLKKRREQKSD
jgi:lysozyme family protein